MAWQLSLKNTGKVPALVTKEKHTCQLQQGQRNVPFPGIGKPAPNNTFLILPDQTGRLSTSFVGDVMGVKVQDVYDGKAILTCDTELSYTAISWWWKTKYVYRANHRFVPEFAAFVMDSGFAD